MEEFFSTSASKSVELVVGSIDENDPVTIQRAFNEVVENYGDRMALMQKDKITSQWKGITYNVYREKVVKMAKVFIKLGLERHGTVAILAGNCVEWFVADLAAVYAGGIYTGIYSSNSVDACHHILRSSNAQIVVVDDGEQLKKICAAKKGLKNVKAVVQIQEPFDEGTMKENHVWRWSELEAMNTDDVDDEYERRQEETTPNQCCAVLYTSGTVGNPKGALISHDNFTWTMKLLAKRLEISAETQEVLMSYLPLSHMAGQIVDLFLSFHVAATVYFADKNAIKSSFLETMCEARPTLFIGVPRIYEKIQAKMNQLESKNNLLRNFAENIAKLIARRHNCNRSSRSNQSSIAFKMAKYFYIDRKKKEIGLDRCRNVLTAAAPMNIELKHYFLSLDLKLKNKCGMTELTVFCVATADTPLDSVGRPIGGVKMKISKLDPTGQGEICVRGRNVFMGYLNDVERTREAIDDDRWLHTGDLGRIDEDGNLFITGRLKEIIITKGGENIPPVHIENLVKAECSAISNAFLVGDNQKYLNILITLKTESDENGFPTDILATETLKWLETMNLSYATLPDILTAGSDAKVFQAVQEAIHRANKKSISNAQKIQKFAIIPRDFSFATGELGPTMKLKRAVVAEQYKDVIEKFYED